MNLSINIHGAEPEVRAEDSAVRVLVRDSAGAVQTVVVTLVTPGAGEADLTFFLRDHAQAVRVAEVFQAAADLLAVPVLAEAGA